jgi:hypothetical protein
LGFAKALGFTSAELETLKSHAAEEIAVVDVQHCKL